jgi:hypothetical protein
LQLKKSNAKFGVLVIDAFGSDAIPLHLLTREALAIYLDRLEPGGLIAFHISNRYVDLEPPIANLVADAKPPCVAWVREHLVLSDEEKEQGISPSIWLVIARQPQDLALLANAPGWRAAKGNSERVWTDDFSNLRQVWRWRSAD